MIHRSDLQERKTFLTKIIKMKEKGLKKFPEGSLRCKKNNNKYPEYYWMHDIGYKAGSEAAGTNTNAGTSTNTSTGANTGTDANHNTANKSKNKTGQYINKKDIKLAQSLAQKDYDMRILEAARRELKVIEKMLKVYKSPVVEEIYNNLYDIRKPLVTPIIPTDEMFIEEWVSEEYSGSSYENPLPYFTHKKERVKSKSEVLIANTLYSHKIPYHYEKPVYLENFITYYPDFTILNVRERKTYIWEHFGRMEDQDYCRKNLIKINNYSLNGYIQGVNLIMTFESESQVIDTRIVEELINCYLL